MTKTLMVWTGSAERSVRWTAHRRKDCSFLSKSTPVEIQVEVRGQSDTWVEYRFRDKSDTPRRRLLRMCSRCG